MLVSRKVDVLHEIGAIEKVRKLNGLMVEWIVNVNIEVAGNDEVMRRGDGAEKKRRELVKKGGERQEARRGR